MRMLNSMELELRDCCKSQYWCWDLYPGLLERASSAITAELSLHPLVCLLKLIYLEKFSQSFNLIRYPIAYPILVWYVGPETKYNIMAVYTFYIANAVTC